MQGVDMVSVLRATNGFHARVVAARLGSEGIVTTLRGPLDGPYPMGGVDVLVHHVDLEVAQEILLVDEVESVFPDGDADPDLHGLEDDDRLDDGAGSRPTRSMWLLAVAVLVAVAIAAVRTTIS